MSSYRREFSKTCGKFAAVTSSGHNDAAIDPTRFAASGGGRQGTENTIITSAMKIN